MLVEDFDHTLHNSHAHGSCVPLQQNTQVQSRSWRLRGVQRWADTCRVLISFLISCLSDRIEVPSLFVFDANRCMLPANAYEVVSEPLSCVTISCKITYRKCLALRLCSVCRWSLICAGTVRGALQYIVPSHCLAVSWWEVWGLSIVFTFPVEKNKGLYCTSWHVSLHRTKSGTLQDHSLL